MKNYFQIFINWFNRILFYGLLNSIKIFFGLKRNKPFSIKYNRNNFYLRGKTVDFAVFDGIMRKGEYLINIPFQSVHYIIDAGANIGASSVFFKMQFPDAKIVAIEPAESNYSLLKKNIIPYTGIKGIQAALWSSNSNVAIQDANAEKYAFQVEERPGENSNTMTGLRLETVLSQNDFPFVDILKIDIEGSEHFIFEENIDSWINKIRLIIIELHDSIRPGASKTFFNAINQIDYDLSISGENIIIFNRSFSE